MAEFILYFWIFLTCLIVLQLIVAAISAALEKWQMSNNKKQVSFIDLWTETFVSMWFDDGRNV